MILVQYQNHHRRFLLPSLQQEHSVLLTSISTIIASSPICFIQSHGIRISSFLTENIPPTHPGAKIASILPEHGSISKSQIFPRHLPSHMDITDFSFNSRVLHPITDPPAPYLLQYMQMDHQPFPTFSRVPHLQVGLPALCNR